MALSDYDGETGAAGDEDDAGAAEDEDIGAAENEVSQDIDSGAFDDDPDAGATITQRLMARARNRIRVMTSKKQARIAAAQRRARNRFRERLARMANRLVPFSALAVADAASVAFTYQAPEKARFLGISVTETVANNFGCTTLSLGTDRLVEASGVSGGSGSSSASSLALWTPNALAKGTNFAHGRLVEGNTQFAFTVINNSGAAAVFRASMLLYVVGKACRTV